MKEDIDEIQ